MSASQNTRESGGGPFAVRWGAEYEDGSSFTEEKTVPTLADVSDLVNRIEIEGYGESVVVWDVSTDRLVPHMDYQGHVTQREFSSYEAMQGDVCEGSR
jgi:hypothetical protein